MDTVGMPEDSAARKEVPVVSGFLDYFPNAVVEVAKVSKFGNDKHNPGQPLHWSRHKSNDHRDCVVRHIMQAGEIGPDGIRHSAEAAWRAMANLEEELIAAGATPGRGTTKDDRPRRFQAVVATPQPIPDFPSALTSPYDEQRAEQRRREPKPGDAKYRELPV